MKAVEADVTFCSILDIFILVNPWLPPSPFSPLFLSLSICKTGHVYEEYFYMTVPIRFNFLLDEFSRRGTLFEILRSYAAHSERILGCVLSHCASRFYSEKLKLLSSIGLLRSWSMVHFGLLQNSISRVETVFSKQSVL